MKQLLNRLFKKNDVSSYMKEIEKQISLLNELEKKVLK